MEGKICSKCNDFKKLEEFSNKTKSKDGKSYICKECHKKYRRNHYLINKTKILKQVREYQRTHNLKKSGRIYQVNCRRTLCKNKANVTKKDFLEGNQRYCSRKCIHLDKPHNPFKYHFNNIIKSAKNRKKEINIDLDYITSLFYKQKEKCNITNIPLVVYGNNKTTKLKNAASLDRIDSTKGYVKGNVQWVSLGINYMKRNFDETELNDLLNQIMKYNERK